MKIVGIYPFKCADQIATRYSSEVEEVKAIITNVDSENCKIKISQEKTMKNKILYSPRALNRAFEEEFSQRQWEKRRIPCEYSNKYYVNSFTTHHPLQPAFREMDFVKNRVGVEVQFGKYAFMVYNVCAKMTIFHKKCIIDFGIEIVPVKQFAEEMSTGVSYFEQFVWDLENRGTSNIDIPVLIFGVTRDT